MNFPFRRLEPGSPRTRRRSRGPATAAAPPTAGPIPAPLFPQAALAGSFIARWLAGLGGVAGGWPSAGAHPSGVAGEPSGVGERAAEEELDLGVGAAQLVAGPSGQGVVDGGVEPEQDAFAFGHRGSVPVVAGAVVAGAVVAGAVVAGAVVTGRGCRC